MAIEKTEDKNNSKGRGSVDWQKKAEEYLNGWKRARADLENYKKEEGKRFEEFAKFANEALIRNLLPVLDSFSLAATSSSDKGLLLLKSQLEEALKMAGLETIKTKAGDKFDPSFHEAVAADSEGKGEVVAEILANGYKLYNRIIRPVRVKVK